MAETAQTLASRITAAEADAHISKEMRDVAGRTLRRVEEFKRINNIDSTSQMLANGLGVDSAWMSAVLGALTTRGHLTLTGSTYSLP